MSGRVIFKYRLEPGSDRVTVKGSRARILSVGADPADPEHVAMWVEHDTPDGTVNEVAFRGRMTGQPIPDVFHPQPFIGTVILSAGIVVHVYAEVI